MGEAGAGRVGDLYLDLLVVHLAGAQLLAEGLTRRGGGARPDEGVENALLGILLGAGAHVLALDVLHQRQRHLDESRMMLSTSRPT